MTEVYFKTIGVVLGLLGGSGGINVFKEKFAEPRTEGKVLVNAIDGVVAVGELWVRDQRRKVIFSLLSPIRLLLSIAYLAILGCAAYLLITGPENVLQKDAWGPLAEELTLGELVLYSVMLAQLAVVYAWLVAIPAAQGWLAFVKASLWLR
jgi:ribosomal protein S28E/S33